MTIYKKNFHHGEKLYMLAHDKAMKSKSYAFGNKIWLYSKYIKIKQNRKFEAKFYGLCQVLYPVRNSAYKLKLLRNERFITLFTYYY